jgi:glutamine cyclotransferase
VLIAFGGTWLVQAIKSRPDVQRYTYKLLRQYPHDETGFTQGLVLKDGIIYESTGKYGGESSIRKSKLTTGEILRKVPLSDRQFGEGLALVGDRLYQLTWKEGVCHVYDLDLNKVREFKYDGQGWGLTYDGQYLIMSDGTARLHFIDPETFEDQRVITVKLGYSSINGLNELEYTGGYIYANRLDWDSVYEIDPKTGDVESIIDLSGLWDDRPPEGVLNGIAVDADSRQLIVTGKYCPHIFEIELVPK